MSTVKQQLLDRLAQEQPDDPLSDLTDEEQAFIHQMVKRGLADSEQGRVISNAEMKKHIEQLTARGRSSASRRKNIANNVKTRMSDPLMP